MLSFMIPVAAYLEMQAASAMRHQQHQQQHDHAEGSISSFTSSTGNSVSALRERLQAASHALLAAGMSMGGAGAGGSISVKGAVITDSPHPQTTATCRTAPRLSPRHSGVDISQQGLVQIQRAGSVIKTPPSRLPGREHTKEHAKEHAGTPSSQSTDADRWTVAGQHTPHHHHHHHQQQRGQLQSEYQRLAELRSSIGGL